MASYCGHSHSEPAKTEQIVTEIFAKSLHVILESRCPFVSSCKYSGEQVLSSSSSSSSSFRPRDKWFNLALRECPAALENIDFWWQTNLEPMIVDVILVQRPDTWDPLNDKIIERWVLQYECKESSGNRNGVGSRSSHALYKKSILLLRSLYATVRLLPAYKLFRDLISTSQIRLYNLGHRVSSFVEPFTSREESDMQRFVFTPIETSCGRLCLSVLYCSSVMDVSSETSTPISPQFIPEYVGSPMTEPLKRFPSGLGRRHSWGFDLYRASSPSMNPSPSPTYSESYAKQYAHCLPQAGLPRHEAHVCHMKNQSYDEYSASTVYSPSPSPPTYVPDSHIIKALRSESSPVNIPASRLSPNRQLMIPSPPTKATRVTASRKVTNSGLHQTTSTVDKFSLSRDGQGKMVKPSLHSSPAKSFSRSSSRLSFQDDYDDSEFSGPFVVDDDDMTDPGLRSGSLDPIPSALRESGERFPVKKSQDAAVGALVRMLKKAPPLCQDTSVPNANSKPGPNPNCSYLGSKTTADAMDELRVYREMKDLLLKQVKNY